MFRSFSTVIFLAISLNSSLAQGSGWYKFLQGTIGKDPVSLHLHKWENEYAGYYYYHSRQEPLYFAGNDTTLAGAVRLLVYLPDRESEEVFEFKLKNDTATGEWRTTGGAKKFPFHAVAVKDTALVKYNFVFAKSSAKLRSSLQDSPEASYEAASVWPAGNSSGINFIKRVISTAWGEKTAQQDIGKVLEKNRKQFIDVYVQENKSMTDTEIKEMGFSLNMNQVSRLMIVYQSRKILTTAIYTYTYSGGAHGNYGTSYASYDLLLSKKLRLSDVITPAGKIKLSILLEKYFRTTYKLKSTGPLTEILFENKIEPNNNFYITGKGIGFCYVPYEIASYAIGEINVFIPFTELTAYLQPGFKKLLQ
jgi:hypothetical protein